MQIKSASHDLIPFDTSRQDAGQDVERKADDCDPPGHEAQEKKPKSGIAQLFRTHVC
jgi:hypothetical protein